MTNPIPSEQLAAILIADVDRIYPWAKHQPMMLEADVLDALAAAVPADLAEAVEVLRECHDALRDHGKQYPHMVKGYTLDAETRARAFLAKWENRHDDN